MRSSRAGCLSCSKRKRTPTSRGYVVLGFVRTQGWRVRCRQCGAEHIEASREFVERNVRGCAKCAGVDGIDLTGRTIEGWKVLGRAESRPGVRQIHWRVVTPCCAQETVRTSQVLREGIGQCKACATVASRVPDHLRFCMWCERATKKGDKAQECGACERRATRNGREVDGRPILKSLAISSAALARGQKARAS